MPSAITYTRQPCVDCPTMPGAYRVRTGYVYLILCRSRIVKIGSSTHPRWRIGEHCFSGSLVTGAPNYRYAKVEKIILSGKHRNFRLIEKQLHRLLKPFQIGHFLNEKYRLPRNKLAALESAFLSCFSSRSALRQLEAA